MKMTLHRALAELKLIDSKIAKQISEIIPVGINQTGKAIGGHILPAEFEKSAKSKYDSVLDLIKRKVDIKAAVVEANGKTDLQINGKTMTIADAINMKNVMALKTLLANTLKAQLKTAVAGLTKNNDKVEENLQKILEATFGKDNTKVNPEDMAAVKTPYLELNQFHLFDPLKVTEKIEALEKEVSDFEMEVDAVLSETNAVTFIEV